MLTKSSPVLGVYATLPISVSLLVLAKALPFDVDDFFVDLYYYFHKSARCREELREFQDFVGISEMKIIKHCPTHWFSLEKVIKRVLHQWEALHAYFDKQAETNSDARVQRVYQKSPYFIKTVYMNVPLNVSEYPYFIKIVPLNDISKLTPMQIHSCEYRISSNSFRPRSVSALE